MDERVEANARWIGRSVGRWQILLGFADVYNVEQGTARSTMLST
jgi:hypothetical protein